MRGALTFFAAAALLAAGHAHGASGPTLRATREAPLTVTGSRFPHGQWIRVMASTVSGTQTKFVRASASGTFRVAFTFRVAACRTIVFVAARRVGFPNVLAQLRVGAGRCG